MVKPDTGRYMTYKGNAEAGEAAHPGAIVESMVHQLVVNANTYKVCAWLSICDRLLHVSIEEHSVHQSVAGASSCKVP